MSHQAIDDLAGERLCEVAYVRHLVAVSIAELDHRPVQVDQTLHRRPAQLGGEHHVEVRRTLVGESSQRTQQHAERTVTPFPIPRVVVTDDISTEDDCAVPGMGDRHPDIGAAQPREGIDRIVHRPDGSLGLGRQVLERLDRDRGQEAGGISEVMGGRGVGHTGPAGNLPKREAGDAPFGQDLRSSDTKRVRQVAVVVGVRCHSTMMVIHLDVVKSDLYGGNLSAPRPVEPIRPERIPMHSAPVAVDPEVHRRRWMTLAVVCLSVFVVVMDGTIVNVALPSLISELGATTRELQWIVDAYLLVFTGLLLAAGSFGDRYGRRRSLTIGLVAFAATSVAAGSVDSPGSLIAGRALMGIGAAFIFPATLAVLTNVFVDTKERAAAIGIWSAMSGMAVAGGPIVGGWLLEHFWWGSVFLINVPLVAIALVGVALFVPESRDRSTPPLDLVGLVLSVAAITAVVFTIIEAPEWGWASTTTAAGACTGVALLAVFVWWELRVEHPMLPVRIFRNLRFSAASVAITSAFFALFGFIFLITQYFQLIRGYTPLEAGLRTIPVAVSIAAASVLSPKLVERIGTTKVVSAGLASMAIGFLWVSTASDVTPYLEIVGQMVFLGAGLGMTTAPATESIMGSLSADKAGVGSAVNDTTRELGGTLGVAVIGSIFNSIYIDSLRGGEVFEQLPEIAKTATEDSVGAAGIVAERMPAPLVPGYLAEVSDAFLAGLGLACIVTAAVAICGSAIVARFLPARASNAGDKARQPSLTD